MCHTIKRIDINPWQIRLSRQEFFCTYFPYWHVPSLVNPNIGETVFSLFLNGLKELFWVDPFEKDFSFKTYEVNLSTNKVICGNMHPIFSLLPHFCNTNYTYFDTLISDLAMGPSYYPYFKNFLSMLHVRLYIQISQICYCLQHFEQARHTVSMHLPFVMSHDHI